MLTPATCPLHRRSKTTLLGLRQAPRSPAHDRLVLNPPLHLGPREARRRTVQLDRELVRRRREEGAGVGEGKEERERCVEGGGE